MGSGQIQVVAARVRAPLLVHGPWAGRPDRSGESVREVGGALAGAELDDARVGEAAGDEGVVADDRLERGADMATWYATNGIHLAREVDAGQSRGTGARSAQGGQAQTPTASGTSSW